MVDSSDLIPIFVCIHGRSPYASGCADKGGADIADKLEAAVAARGLKVRIERMHCLGYCEIGPNLRLGPGGRFVHGVSMDTIEDILDEIAALVSEG